MDPGKLRFGECEVLRDARGGPWLLGAGSCGQTYKARHMLLGTGMAIKVIRREVLASEAARQRFLAEGRALANLTHENIAMLRTFGRTEDGQLYYAMDFCAGGTLAERVRQLGPRPPGEAFEIARQVALALAAAHGAGIIHRDLKPGNIMLAQPPPPLRVKVIDFGLAQTAGPGMQGGRFQGTAQWASPEQLREEPLDGRSDLFSLGLVLLYLLDGAPPDQGSTAEIIGSRLRSGGYAGRLPRDWPPAVAGFLGRLLETEPQRRFGSATELLDSLGHVQRMFPYQPDAVAEDAREEPGAGELPRLAGGASLEERYAGLARLHRDLAGEWFEAEQEGAQGTRIVFVLDESWARNPGLRAQVRANLSRLWRQPVAGLPRFSLLQDNEGGLAAEWQGAGGGDLASWLRLRRKPQLRELLGFLAEVARIADEAVDAGLPGVGLMAPQVRLASGGGSEAGGGLGGAVPCLFPLLLDVADLPSDGSTAAEAGGSTLALVGPETACDHLVMLARLAYRMVAGREPAGAVSYSAGAYVDVAGLSEAGNRLLRDVLSGDGSWDSCRSLLGALAAAEGLSLTTGGTGGRGTAGGSRSGMLGVAPAPGLAPAAALPPGPVPPSLPAVTAAAPAPERSGKRRVLLALLLAGLVTLALAVGAVVGVAKLWKRASFEEPQLVVAHSDAALEVPASQWQAMAEAGDALAQALLARAYFFGLDGMPLRRDLACQWARKSAEQDHPLGWCLRGLISHRDEAQPADARMTEAGEHYANAFRAGFEAWFVQGGPRAMTMMGFARLYGYGIAHDATEAVRWFRQAAEAGDAVAMEELALCHATGIGTAQDDTEAVKWYRRAAEAGYAMAMTSLGYCHENGTGVPADQAAALQWYRKAADAGDTQAMTCVGACYETGTGVAKDPVEAAAWYRRAAELGNPRGATGLGFCYERGTGVVRDEGEAARWYRKAAEAGDPQGMINLGVCCELGKGVAKDPVQAVRWYRAAEQAGYAAATTCLGVCYEAGIGVPRDEAEAVKCYRSAAERFDARAMTCLGACYGEGIGVAKDEAEALRWYRQGAEAGDARAMSNLGTFYYNGIAVAKDGKEAVRWFRQAAEAGNAPAMTNLGLCFETGTGVDEDRAEALRWYRQGAEAGDETAKAAVQRLEQ